RRRSWVGVPCPSRSPVRVVTHHTPRCTGLEGRNRHDEQPFPPSFVPPPPHPPPVDGPARRAHPDVGTLGPLRAGRAGWSPDRSRQLLQHHPVGGIGGQR